MDMQNITKNNGTQGSRLSDFDVKAVMCLAPETRSLSIIKREKYRLNNRASSRRYYQSHKKYFKEYKKKKLRTNIQFLLSERIRNRFNLAVRNGSKGGSAVKLLGCNISEFKIYIESKFKKGMSWRNYGLKGWHLDHIVPLSNFDLTKTSDVKKACHYSNIQPLWAIENIIKSNRL